MSEKRAIARAAGVVSVVTVLSRITGLARDVVVGYFFGAGAGADAFFVAYRIPNLLRRLVGEGATTAAFIPIFTGYLTTGSRRDADRVAQVLFTVMGVVLVAVTILGIALAGPLTRLFAPGFAASPGKLDLAITLTRLVFPYIFLIGLVAAAMGVLNSLREFSTPGASPVVMNVVVVIAVAALASRLGIYASPVAVVLGGVGAAREPSAGAGASRRPAHAALGTAPSGGPAARRAHAADRLRLRRLPDQRPREHDLRVAAADRKRLVPVVRRASLRVSARGLRGRAQHGGAAELRGARQARPGGVPRDRGVHACGW